MTLKFVRWIDGPEDTPIKSIAEIDISSPRKGVYLIPFIVRDGDGEECIRRGNLLHIKQPSGIVSFRILPGVHNDYDMHLACVHTRSLAGRWVWFLVSLCRFPEDICVGLSRTFGLFAMFWDTLRDAIVRDDIGLHLLSRFVWHLRRRGWKHLRVPIP